MAYATNTDIAPEFPALAANGGFTSSTKVTAAQVDEFCTQESNFIDSKIGGKWSVPVSSGTSPNAFSLLKRICIALVYPRVAKVVGVATGDSKTSTGQNRKDEKQWALDTLKEIQAGEMILTDGTLATTTDGAESYTDDNSSTLQPPTFTREDDQW